METREVRSCSELPDSLKEEILKRLPVECICRFRSVSQKWNAFLTSTRFITTEWADFPSNKKPWLVLCDLDCKIRCWAYCFSTMMWKPYFSLRFINKWDSDAYYHGSATGLLFVNIQKQNDLIVCNPLTGRSVMLPAPSSVRAPSYMLAKGIVAGKCDGDLQTYKVVAVCEEQGADNVIQSVEIYDSSEKSWTTARYVPDRVSVMGQRMVFSDGYFYCKATFEDNARTRGIVGLSLQNDSSLFTPLPPDLANGNMFYNLVACGSRILLVGWVWENRSKILQEVHIWELQKVNVDSHIDASWLEIARMPPLIHEDVKRIWPLERCFQFVGVGDCVCFRGRRSMEVAIYSLTENAWSWLPSCPLQNDSSVSNRTWIYSFEPRPDMKVS